MVKSKVAVSQTLSDGPSQQDIAYAAGAHCAAAAAAAVLTAESADRGPLSG
jgi:hypothetical protein